MADIPRSTNARHVSTHRGVGLTAGGTIMVWRLELRSSGNSETTLWITLIGKRHQYARIKCQDFRGRSCVGFKGATSAIKISLYFFHSKFELGSRETGVGYKIPPQPKFVSGVPLQGFYRRPTFGDIFPNLSGGRASATFPSSVDG